jgi:long-subunit fatty acid transport protein
VSPPPSALSDVASVVGRLAAARAAAFSSASEAALGRVDAPGSAALAEDLAFVRRLRAAGVRLEGLRFTVGDVRVVAATGDGVTVEAQVATSGYRQVRPDGTVARTVPAQPARRVQLTLVRAAGAWRVSSVV